MEKLRKQIRESFFNPILHFLPLILFLVADDFWGMDMAWKVSFPISLALLIYVYYVYGRIFTWHLIFTIFYLVVSVFATIAALLPQSIISHEIIYELVLVAFLLVFLLFRKKIQKSIQRVVSGLIPMTNNFNELYRVIWIFFSVLLLYSSGFLVLQHLHRDAVSYQQMLQYVYISIVLFLVLYELLRVQIIRSKLFREEWWPIVNTQGKIMGSIQQLTSLNDDKKYMHPVVRILFIDKSMVLLRKNDSDDPDFPGLWDTTLSSHVQMDETIEQCVEQVTAARFSLDNFKYMYLSNYTIECKREKQYAFLFISCQQVEYDLNPTFSEQTKWWTQEQIKDNLASGIFTANFLTEFDLLQRSGLLETGKCHCNCRLKEAIYNQSSSVRKV